MDTGGANDVRVHVASFQAATATELTVRTMREFAGHPFDLVVGDSGSTDGSLQMLRRLESEGWLVLEVASGGRQHAQWLDSWLESCPCRFAVFVDSDVEFLAGRWLRDMVEAAESSGAALVATRIQATEGVPYQHPVTGAERILAPRPEPWLLLVDVEQVRGVVTCGFGYRDEVDPSARVRKVAYDVGAAFFRDLRAAGLGYVEMPAAFADAYHHFGGLSWQRAGDRTIPLRRRVKQAAKRVLVRVHLMRARRRTRHLPVGRQAGAPGAAFGERL